VLSGALSNLGRFDEAIGHAEAAVRIGEEIDHSWTLFLGLWFLGLAHLGRGDFARAARVLERSLHLGRTWQFVDRTPDVAAALGYAYALAGRTEESLALVAGAVNEFRARQGHVALGYILLSAGRVFLLAGRIDEATNYVREHLALARRLGARGLEAHALFLMADVAAASGTEIAEDYYREALALAEPRGMRPQVAHCHFGLGKLHRRRGDREHAQEHLATAMAMYREMGMAYWLDRAEAELRQLD
jgi:tetratricopeptide (TPR) repeat protein